MPTERVSAPVKSAWASKINWGALIAAGGMILANFGIDLDAETQAAVLSLIIGGSSIWTWIMRTFFTSSITPGSKDR